MNYCGDIKEIMFSAEQIKKRIDEMAKQIAQDYAGKRPLVIGVLKGAWIFVADLLRSLELPADVDFICASSYGSGTSTTAEWRRLKT